MSTCATAHTMALVFRTRMCFVKWMCAMWLISTICTLTDILIVLLQLLSSHDMITLLWRWWTLPVIYFVCTVISVCLFVFVIIFLQNSPWMQKDSRPLYLAFITLVSILAFTFCTNVAIITYRFIIWNTFKVLYTVFSCWVCLITTIYSTLHLRWHHYIISKSVRLSFNAH